MIFCIFSVHWELTCAGLLHFSGISGSMRLKMSRNWAYPLWWWLCYCSKEDKCLVQTIVINPMDYLREGPGQAKKTCSNESVRRQFRDCKETIHQPLLEVPLGDLSAPNTSWQKMPLPSGDLTDKRKKIFSRVQMTVPFHTKIVLEAWRHCQNHSKDWELSDRWGVRSPAREGF